MGFTNLINKGKGKGEKNSKSRKVKKKHTNSIARIQARSSSPAVSFACLKLYHAAKE